MGRGQTPERLPETGPREIAALSRRFNEMAKQVEDLLAARTVLLRVPKTAFGDGDPAKWGYAAVVLGQEGYPSAGVWRVRDVEEKAAQWRFGGAPADNNHPRIIDLIWPGDKSPSQKDFLSKYTSSKAEVGTLKPDDFAQIPLLIP